MSDIAVGTRRQYAEQSLKWDAAVASEKTDDELLQRIWNLAEDSLHIIAAFEAAEAENAKMKELLYEDDGLNGVVPQLHRAEDEVARLREASTEYLDRGSRISDERKLRAALAPKEDA